MRKQDLHPRTAVINKTQKNQSKQQRLNALHWLANKFPDAFDNNQRIRPLKVGIIDDILQYANEADKEGISRSKLREAIVLFTRRIDYLTCLKAREKRIDLFGNPTEEVTEEDAERASLKIKKRVEKSTRNAKKIFNAKSSEKNNYHQPRPEKHFSPKKDNSYDTYLPEEHEKEHFNSASSSYSNQKIHN